VSAGGGADVLIAARALGPEIRLRGDEIESLRHLPPDLARRLGEARLYDMWAPATVGGLELPLADGLESLEALAQADGSTAWCAFIGATSAVALAYLDESAAREIASRPGTLLAGVYAPRGTAEAVDEGYRVTGRWSWGSGIHNADWVMAGCQRVVGGEVERVPNGPPVPWMMIAPKADVDLLDTWHVSGLCGTGSTDFVMHDVVVPARRAVSLIAQRPIARPLYVFSPFTFLATGIAAVTMGLARAAIDEVVALARDKRPEGSGRSLAERSTAQADVARAEALLRSGRAFFYGTIASLWETAQAMAPVTLAQRRDVRLATTHAVRASAEAVDLMYHLAGGTAVYRRSPLSRIFRDIHVATQHVMVSPSTLELTGRLLLGVPTDTTLL
jgi:alkylation response protein AidB-like acyl-CoA dehydrogenase